MVSESRITDTGIPWVSPTLWKGIDGRAARWCKHANRNSPNSGAGTRRINSRKRRNADREQRGLNRGWRGEWKCFSLQIGMNKSEKTQLKHQIQWKKVRSDGEEHGKDLPPPPTNLIFSTAIAHLVGRKNWTYARNPTTSLSMLEVGSLEATRAWKCISSGSNFTNRPVKSTISTTVLTRDGIRDFVAEDIVTHEDSDAQIIWFIHLYNQK